MDTIAVGILFCIAGFYLARFLILIDRIECNLKDIAAANKDSAWFLERIAVVLEKEH